VPGNVQGSLGFQSSPWTPAGQIERAGPFARGLRSAGLRRLATYALVLVAVLALLLIALVVIDSI
jgi:hypothetical protein